MVYSDDRTTVGTHLDMSMSSALPFIFPDIASSSTDPATVPSCNHQGLQPRDRLYLNPDAMYARCPPVGLRRLRRHKLRPLDKPLIPYTQQAIDSRAAYDAAIDTEEFDALDSELLN